MGNNNLPLRRWPRKCRRPWKIPSKLTHHSVCITQAVLLSSVFHTTACLALSQFFFSRTSLAAVPSFWRTWTMPCSGLLACPQWHICGLLLPPICGCSPMAAAKWLLTLSQCPNFLTPDATPLLSLFSGWHLCVYQNMSDMQQELLLKSGSKIM